MEDQQLQRRYMELADRAYRSGRYTYTNFLNLQELDAFSHMGSSLRHIPHTLWGGAEGCERKMIQFGSSALFGYDEDMPIACVHVQPVHAKFSDALTHRDFLGAVMNLGIEREMIGDILVIENAGYMFCLARIAPYIIEQLIKVRHTTVACAIVAELPDAAVPSTETVTLQVTSERLDAVVAHLYKLSRGNAQELFQSGRVFVNNRMQENCSYTPKSGDIVSVRGYGRFLYGGIAGKTKKGKHAVSVGKYV